MLCFSPSPDFNFTTYLKPVDLEIDEYYAFLVPGHCTIPYVDHTIALLITLGHAVYVGILYNEVKVSEF